MKKSQLICILLILSKLSFAQDNNLNLQKYWFYKDRLKNFVWVNSDYNEEGSNIPASAIGYNACNGQTGIWWDDGNVSFKHYISVLATEYRLLKDYGQDYSETVNRLYYALKSFERLDATAESYYRPGHEKYAWDLNGFFIRKDITPAFKEKYKKYGTYNNGNGYFSEEILGGITSYESVLTENHENSQDNCWNYLEAFSLVNALVDNEYVNGELINFKKIACDNVSRIIGNMVHFDNPQPALICGIIACYTYPLNWYIKNPATGKLVAEGNGTDFTQEFLSYGFSRAASNIAKVNYTPETISELLFKTILAHKVASYRELYLKFDNRVYYNPFSLTPQAYIDIEIWGKGEDWDVKLLDIGPNHSPSVSINSEKIKISNDKFGWDDFSVRSLCAYGNITDIYGNDPYDILVTKQRENPHHPYEHLPLIWSLINNNNTTHITQEDKNFVAGLLNSAPLCGPNKLLLGTGVYSFRDQNWSAESRLNQPENNNNSSNLYGEYNGLDYMLLHNLNWLANIKKYPVFYDYNPAITNETNISATNKITCSKAIPSNLTIQFTAGKSITLLPGFSFTSSAGSRFLSVIFSDNDPDFIRYKKVSLIDYTCDENLKSAKSYYSKPNEPVKASEETVDVFPNPFKTSVTVISLISAIKKIEMINSFGKVIKSLDNISSFQKVDLSDIMPGVYFLRVKTSDGKIELKKLIKSE